MRTILRHRVNGNVPAQMPRVLFQPRVCPRLRSSAEVPGPKKGPQVFAGGTPDEPDANTIPLNERYPDLPEEVLSMVGSVGRVLLHPEYPRIPGGGFRSVRVEADGRVIQFNGYSQGSFKIGRSGNNHLMIFGAEDRRKISRRHAEIYVDPNGYVRLRDTSLNGTEVNGENYKYAEYHLDPSGTHLQLIPGGGLSCFVSYDAAGDLEIQVLNAESLRLALKRDRDSDTGYVLTPRAAKDRVSGSQAEEATVTRIFWMGEGEDGQFQEGVRVDTPVIIDMPKS